MKEKYLLDNTKIIFIGSLLSKIINFTLISVYTKRLTVSEYGTIDIINSYRIILITIITCDIFSSITRFSLDKNKNKKDILSIGTIVFMMSSIIYVLLFGIFKKIDIISPYAISIIFYLITSTLLKMLSSYVIGIEKTKLYSFINITQSILVAVINIIFIKMSNFGINEYIFTQIIVNAIISSIIIYKEKIYMEISLKNINRELLKKMIKYSFFFIPNSFFDLIIYSLDKLLLTYFISVNANGLYAAANNLPYIIFCLSNIFNDSWMISNVKENENDEKECFVNKILNYYFSLTIILISSFIIILKPFMKIYVSSSFYNSWIYAIPLLISSLFMAISTFISNEYIANKDSKRYLYSSIVGAIVSLSLNLTLIPFIGIMGAAITNCISSFVMLVYRYFDIKKYLKLNLFKKDNIISILLLIILGVISYFDNVFLDAIKIIIFLVILFLNNIILVKIKNRIIKKLKS